jgi:hypothetical protein
MNNILDSKNPCKTYSKLKMKLAILGIDTIPKERIFDLAKSEPNRWECFCNAVDYYNSLGRPLDRINSYTIMSMAFL